MYLLGGITCCGNAKARGWPLVNDGVLSEISAARGNYTHIRLGPNSLSSPDGDHTAYARVGGRLDLERWDEAYWSRVRGVVESARSKGIYIEVSLIDGWVFKHPEYAAWTRTKNIQGFDAGGCGQFAAAPHPYARAWVRKVVSEIGSLDNVLWLDGNEVFDCGQDPEAWTLGLGAEVRSAETSLGFPHHPFGTNTHQNLAFKIPGGYEVVHGTDDLASHGRPLIVNEFRGINTAANYCEYANEAVRGEASFMLWRGNMNNEEWRKSLACISDIKGRLGF